jgi:hypothetical protein
MNSTYLLIQLKLNTIIKFNYNKKLISNIILKNIYLHKQSQWHLQPKRQKRSQIQKTILLAFFPSQLAVSTRMVKE